jgi:hypothetical protein
MPTPVQTQDLNLFGLDTGTSPFLVRDGGFLQAQNVVMKQKGRWESRYGIAPLPTLPQLGALEWCTAYGNELLVGSSSGEQSSWTPGTNGWLPKGTVQPIDVTTEVAAGSVNDKTNVDLAINASFGGGNAFSCYAWIEQGSCMFCVEDENGGQVMAPQSATPLSFTYPFASVRVVAIGPWFVLVTLRATTAGETGIVTFVVNPIQRTIAENALVGSNGATCLDARAVALATVGHSGQYVAIVWGTASGAWAAGFDPWAQAAVIPSVQIDTFLTTSICATWGNISSTPVVAVLQNRNAAPNLALRWLSPNTLVESSAIGVDSPITGATFGKLSLIIQSPNWTCVYEESATASGSTTVTQPSVKVASGNLTAVTSTGYAKRNMQLAGDLFAANGALFAPTVYQGASLVDQPTFFIEQILTTGATETARIQQSNAGGFIPTLSVAGYTIQPTSAPVPQWTGSCFGAALLTQSSASFDSTFVPCRCVARCTVKWGAQPFSAQLGADTHLTGGFLSMYDGLSIVEHNFHVTPEPLAAQYSGIAIIRTALGAASGAAQTLVVDDTNSAPGLTFTAINQNQPAFTVTFVAGSGYGSQVSGNAITISYNDTQVPTVQWYLNTGQIQSDANIAKLCSVFGNGASTGAIYAGGPFTSTPTYQTASPPEAEDFYVPPDLQSPDGTKYGSGWQIPPGAYILLMQTTTTTGQTYSQPNGYIWFTVDGVGVDPAPVASGGILCALRSIDNAEAVATKLAAALTSSPSYSGGAVSMPKQGTPPTGGPGQQTWKVSVQAPAGSASVGPLPGIPPAYCYQFRADAMAGVAAQGPNGTGAITCPLGTAINPGGYFVLPYSSTEFLVFYYVVNGVGSAPAGPIPAPQNANTATVTAIPISSWWSATHVAAETVSIIQSLGLNWVALGNVGPTIVYNNGTSGGAGVYDVSSSGVIPDGLYEVCATWERTDAAGQLEQSGPSLATPIPVQGAGPSFDPFGASYTTSGSGILSPNPSGSGMLMWGFPVGGSALFVSCPSLWATHKTSQLAVYRTTVNAGQNPTFYRVTSAGASPYNVTNPTGPDGTFTNPVTGTVLPQDFAYVFDALTDVQIQSNAGLYTEGGVFDNAAIPALSYVHVHRGRLWGVLSDSLTNQIRYSEPWEAEAQLAVEFADDLSIDVPQDGGKVVALATIDDKLIVLCQFGLYYVTGDGPTSNDVGDFNPIQPIMSDAGCVSAGSVVQTPEGIWFQSQKGPYFLDRNLVLNLQRGRPAQALFAGKTCNAAILMQDRPELRFFCSATAGGARNTSDYCVVYNYLYDVWSQFTKWAGNAAVLWQGQCTFVDSAGNVEVEAADGSASQYLDNGAYIAWLVQTGWVGKAVGLQGWLRCPRAAMLGVFESSHNVQIQVQYDYESTLYPVLWEASAIENQQAYAQAQLLNSVGSATPYGITDGSAWQFRLFPPPSLRGGRVMAVSFTVSSVQDQPNGGAFALDALTVELQGFGRLSRSGTSRSTG